MYLHRLLCTMWQNVFFIFVRKILKEFTSSLRTKFFSHFSAFWNNCFDMSNFSISAIIFQSIPNKTNKFFISYDVNFESWAWKSNVTVNVESFNAKWTDMISKKVFPDERKCISRARFEFFRNLRLSITIFTDWYLEICGFFEQYESFLTDTNFDNRK